MVASKAKSAKLKQKLKDKKRRRKERLKERRANTQSVSRIDIDAYKESLEQIGEVEYVAAVEIPEDDPNFADFHAVFEHFQPEEEEQEEEQDYRLKPDYIDDDEEEEDTKPKKSNKQKKKERRMKVSQLKQMVRKPELVDAHDANSPDPIMLVHLKGYKNCVTIPDHWTSKRRYLQGKRGVEKIPYDLPEYIQATGISKVRQAMIERDQSKRLAQKAKDHMAPKMGQLTLDYQVLHDAFFRFQTKPSLTNYGDLYYENKEFEVETKSKKPGHLSTDLKKALGMPEGAPPPWLINMQRFGPPPSYPNLKIPGLNAPIPDGAQYGFHPGGWGKPPVDQYGNPLYGDVFGQNPITAPDAVAPVERKHWGEIEFEDYLGSSDDSSSEESEGGSESMDEDDEVDETGVDSVPAGLETPDTIQLTKDKPDVDYSDKHLYKVLEQKETSVGDGLVGTTHTYSVGQDISINPGDLDKINEDLLSKKPEDSKGKKEDKKYDYKF